MSRKWISERRRDHYYKMAKKQQYRSRAAFKLKQLNNKFRFLNGAKYILDLGSAPGGWLQVASEAVSEDGLIVGVDLEKVKPLLLKNVKTLEGDIREEETLLQIKNIFTRKIDVVLSDLSPNLSGVWELDQYRQIELARSALKTAISFLNSEGWFVAKIFQGADYENFLEEVRRKFSYMKIIKPRASRKESAEVYIVAKGIQSSSP